MTPEERKVFDNIRSPHLKYWIPVVWFSNLASKARQEGRIQDSIDLQNILNVTDRRTIHILFSMSKDECVEVKPSSLLSSMTLGGQQRALTCPRPVSAPGDEPVQDLVCDSLRLRLGRHPTGLHTGLSYVTFQTDAAHLIISSSLL